MRPLRAGHAQLACEVNPDVRDQQQEPAEVVQIVKSGHGRNLLALTRGGCQTRKIDTGRSHLTAALYRLGLLLFLLALLGGCGNIHRKNLSDDFLIQRAARALKVAPQALTLSNRRGYGTLGIGFDITVKDDPQRYACSIFIDDYFSMGWSLSPGGCGCYIQQDDGLTVISQCPERE